MSILKTEGALIGLAVLAGAGLLWYATRPGVAGRAAGAAVGFVNDAAVGTVKSLGQIVGIPDTNSTQCRRDLAAGKYWDASFSCPAGTYLAGVGSAARQAVFGSTGISAAEANDARREYAQIDPRRVDL